MTEGVEETLAQAFALHKAQKLAEAESLYRRVLAEAPDKFLAYYLFGILCFQQGRNVEALALLGKALGLQPEDPQALLNFAAVLQAMGRVSEALNVLGRTVQLHPYFAEAWGMQAGILMAQNRTAEALESYDAALRITPQDVFALNNRGICLRTLKRLDEALACYDAALAVEPDFADAHNNRATVLRELRRLDEALASYDRAVALRPELAEIHCYRGRLLYDLERFEEALAGFDAALALKPDYADAHDNRGTTARNLGRPEEAFASYSQALIYKPRDADLLTNLGGVMLDLHRYDEALKYLDAALNFNPRSADAYANAGIALQELGRFEEALAAFDSALALKPDFPEALSNRGFTLLSLSRPQAAVNSFDAAQALGHDRASLSGLAMATMSVCDWTRTAALAARLRQQVTEEDLAVLPFVLMGTFDDPALLLTGSRLFAAKAAPARPALWNGVPYRHDKIRIAYLSADFHEHATAYLMAGLFEAHDRARFEISAISWGPDDDSAMRQRLKKGFDHFHDVREQSDEQIARLLNTLEIDIAVDLKGFTQGCRPAILSYRPCPVQVQYLGYPGTMGGSHIDYILADEIVAPFAHQAFFSEQIVHLPGCYQVNDDRRMAAEIIPTRAELGLPDKGFVLCCFNNNWKITQALFDIWMRVLLAVPDSVLWLLEDSADAKENFRAAAAARNVDPARLVFAARLPLKEHLARQRQADLFVDTLPYNAHTTASDALWMDVPLVTFQGKSFAGRVAASLLHAVGLPELVTETLEDYEALILKLATDPAALSSVRAKLKQNRLSQPLFDTDAFRRHVEAAYTKMWTLAEAGQAAQSFAAPPA